MRSKNPIRNYNIQKTNVGLKAYIFILNSAVQNFTPAAQDFSGCLLTNALRKSHVPFIMFYRRILTRVKPSRPGRYSLPSRAHYRQSSFPPSIFTLSPEDRWTRSWVDFRYCALRWVSSISSLRSHLLRSPIRSRTINAERRVSPLSSQSMSRKTSAINHRPPSFRFRLEDRAELRRERAGDGQQQSQKRETTWKTLKVSFNLAQPQKSAGNGQKCGEWLGRSCGEKYSKN